VSCLERGNIGLEKEERVCQRIDVGLREPTRVEHRIENITRLQL
jgi:hypothetical protein